MQLVANKPSQNSRCGNFGNKKRKKKRLRAKTVLDYYSESMRSIELYIEIHDMKQGPKPVQKDMTFYEFLI